MFVKLVGSRTLSDLVDVWRNEGRKGSSAMAQELTASIVEHFAGVEDPRVERRREHQLMDIFVIAISAVVCGANDWVAVETFGKAKENWLRKFLALPYGIPSH